MLSLDLSQWFAVVSLVVVVGLVILALACARAAGIADRCFESLDRESIVVEHTYETVKVARTAPANCVDAVRRSVSAEG